MPLIAGTTVGPYEIVSALGVGGMGEVYRARDRKLNRDVAIKVLPAALAADPDRIARFEREAQVLASLNHPNIAHLYGVEESGGVRALVLELVEGETLAERIARGAMRGDEALAIARQIALALEAAHEPGIVHRDLKPANIKLTPSGVVKVLDFGLAKAIDSAGPAADLTNSPTLTGRMTRDGIILGTAAYMSPEQARGEIVDKRADIWAFGAVLFEMLSGAPLFLRKTVAETIAAVLHADPDWTRVPPRFQTLLRACLNRNPGQRLRDIGDAWLLLDDERSQTPVARDRMRNVVPWAAAAMFALAAAWALLSVPSPSLPGRPIRFQIAPAGELPESAASAISPDGRYLAFLASGADRVLRVWVRDLESLEDRQLLGTEISQAAPPPFWSPDSRFIAYDAGGALKKIDVSGGLAQTICDLRQPAVGGTWNREGVILFGNIVGGIMRVPDAGGVPSEVTAVDTSRGEDAHLTPVFLPDGRHFLYLRVSRNNVEQTGLFVGSLDRQPGEQDSRRLLAATASPVYSRGLSGAAGKLLFLRDGNLMAQSFDESRLELTGTPILVAERVHAFLDTATVSASNNGVLVYKSASQNSQLTWMDRAGRVLGRVSEPALYDAVSLSPDGSRAVVLRTNPQVTSTAGLWLVDLATNRSSRFTSTVATQGAVWSPDASRIAFVSGNAETLLMQKPADGSGQEELLFQSEDRAAPASWSKDGRFLLYVVVNAKTNSDLWMLAVDGSSKPVPFLRSDAAEGQAQFSPDRQASPSLVAFTSNETGRDEIHLRTFPDAQNRVIVSNGGGHSPRWRADGKELFYIAEDGMVTSAAILDRPLRIGAVTPLFRAPRGFAIRDATGRRGSAPWDVRPDGQGFLMAAPLEGELATQFTVVLNWSSVETQ